MYIIHMPEIYKGIDPFEFNVEVPKKVTKGLAIFSLAFAVLIGAKEFIPGYSLNTDDIKFIVELGGIGTVSAILNRGVIMLEKRVNQWVGNRQVDI